MQAAIRFGRVPPSGTRLTYAADEFQATGRVRAPRCAAYRQRRRDTVQMALLAVCTADLPKLSHGRTGRPN